MVPFVTCCDTNRPLWILHTVCQGLLLLWMFYSMGGATFIKAPRTGICHGTFEIVPQEVLWSIWGSHKTLWSPPLSNVTWHIGTWPYTMTHSIDQTLHQFAYLLPNWTLLTILTLLPNFGGFHRILQRMRLANRGRLLLRTPGPVPFGTCICSNVETILSWTCHVYGPFESRTSLGTSVLLYMSYQICCTLFSIWLTLSIQFKTEKLCKSGVNHRITWGASAYSGSPYMMSRDQL